MTVSQLIRRIRNLIEVDLGQLWIEGEVSNLKKQGSGHWYFTLKDDNAQIQCAMFGAAKRMGSQFITDGAKLRVFAEATVYEARGSLQIIILKAEPLGVGDLQARFEALKEKLKAEGLFESNRKKKLPAFPKRIGIITSETGAVIQDITHVLSRRAPWVTPVLIPVRVQGVGAKEEIVAAIEKFSSPEKHGISPVDLLIIGRGGGSLEDLWAFNEESVARAIAACPLPTISAVGHETDFTIADFVADLRAPTPSAAAEISTPDRNELLATLAALSRRMEMNVQSTFKHYAYRLQAMQRGVLSSDGSALLTQPSLRLDHMQDKHHRAMENFLYQIQSRLTQAHTIYRNTHPRHHYLRMEEKLSSLQSKMHTLAEKKITQAETKSAHLLQLLTSLNPKSSLARGFTMTTDAQGKILRSKTEALAEKNIITHFSDGSVSSTPDRS